MGLFIGLSGVIGKTEQEVASALQQYAKKEGGDLQPFKLHKDHDNCCLMQAANGNCTIFHPNPFLGWDDASEYLSQELKAAVVSLHIHDGDFWVYTLYVNGEVADQYMPIPDYFDEHISEEEKEGVKGDADVVAGFVPGLKPESIRSYLVVWNLDADPVKAYPDDEFASEEWQLVDFMRKLGLPTGFSADDAEQKCNSYKMWTKGMPAR